MVNFEIVINSGQSVEYRYRNKDNIAHLEVTDSDNQYYQTGFFELFDIDNEHQIGDTVDILINGQNVVRGYISRREQTIDKGRKLLRYQLIGETYDLWRWHTDDYAIYSGTTTYIASSLVSSYCSGVIGYFNTTGGVNLTSDIDLRNTTVGDAISRLTKIDGYRFYVNKGKLYYYKPAGTTTATFTITDSDIISMNPVEETDEDIVNDVLVVGANTYCNIVNVGGNTSYSNPIVSGMLYAQKFKVDYDTLSAVKLYLGRSEDPYQPNQLLFEIWRNTEQTLFDDHYSNYKYLNSSNGYNMRAGNWPVFNTSSDDKFSSYLTLSYTSSLSEITPQPPYDTPKACKMLAQVFKCSTNANVLWAYMPSTILYDDDYDYHRYLITATGSTGAPDLNYILASSQFNSFSWDETRYYFPNTPRIQSGNSYALVLVSKDYPTEPTSDCYDAWVSSGIYGDHGKYYVYTNGNWNGTSATTPFKICYINFPTSGEIQSKSIPKKTRYIYISSAIVSGAEKIQFSGSNDNGSSWYSLSNKEWVDLGSEDTAGTIIKYKFSSNGYYTPIIDRTLAKVSDSSGGFQITIWSDDFSDDSNLSYLSGMVIDSGDLRLSGSSILQYIFPSRISDDTWTWYDTDLIFDDDENTYGYTDWKYFTSTYVHDYQYFLISSNNIGFYANRIKTQARHQESSDAVETQLLDIWISGDQWENWTLFWHGNYTAYDYDEHTFNTGELITNQYSNKYFTGVKKVKIHLRTYGDSYGAHIGWRDYFEKVKIFKLINHDGKVSSNTFETINDIYYIKIIPNGHYTNKIIYYASADSGSTWQQIEPNIRTKLPNHGKYIKIKMQFSPLSGNISIYPNTPKLDSIIVYGYGLQGGGIPQSGSKYEWSDDISFYASDIPYPPSYSSWKQYSDPKLKLAGDEVNYNIGDYAWFVLQGPNVSETITFDTRNFNDSTKWHVDQETHANIDDSNGYARTLDYNPGTNDPAIGRWNYPSGSFNGSEYTNPLPAGAQYVTITQDLPKYFVSMRVRGDSSLANNAQIRLKVGKSGTACDSYVIDIYPTIPSDWTVYTACLTDFYDYEISAGTMLWYYLDIYAGADIANASPPDSLYVDWIKIFGYPQIWYFYNDPDSTYDGEIAISDDGGVSWTLYAANESTDVPKGNMKFKLGWDKGQIMASAQNQTSIDLYGRHFKKISDSNITTYEMAQARADYEVSGSESVPKKGTITIIGRTDLSPQAYFSANLSNFGINEKFSVRSYTHTIDKNGFLTTINYGRHPFDYIKKLTDIERKVS